MSNYTADQLALKAHIEAANAAWVARCEADGATWYSTTTTDLDHWAGYDVYTIAQYERYNMLSSIWDLYKDVNGFRPRHIDFNAMSDEELAAEYDSLIEELNRNNEREIKREVKAIAEFEARIADLISMGAGDRNTALRWIADGSGEDNDMGYLCYELGIPYSYADDFLAAFAEVKVEAA